MMQHAGRRRVAAAIALATVSLLAAGCGKSNHQESSSRTKSPVKIVDGCEIGQNAKCPSANLARADLARANLAGADLTYADLSGVNLASANLQGADLQGADLSGADLMGAMLEGTDLDHTNLAGADFGDNSTNKFTICPDGKSPPCTFP